MFDHVPPTLGQKFGEGPHVRVLVRCLHTFGQIAHILIDFNTYNQVKSYSTLTLKLFTFVFFLQALYGCRIAQVVMQYCVGANYFWLLVEGLYLHNLLVLLVFSENSYFCGYLALGWGQYPFSCRGFWHLV